jgi:heme exporter protein A
MRNEVAGQIEPKAPKVSGERIAFLATEHVTAIRGGRTLFRELSFRVEAGRVLSVEGANGAGKTSLLRMIAGFLAPAEGTIALQTNGAVVADGEERGKYIGWLGHHDAVKPQMSVREILQFYAALYGPGGSINSALDAAGLVRLADLPGQYLSAGQKKRVSLARLLVCNRPLWLMDEPLASLDAAGKKIAAGLVEAHCAGGGIAVVATHEALGIDCERLVL